jgi:hypothetical protein
MGTRVALKVKHRQVFSHALYGFNNIKYPLYINGKKLVESDLERDSGISLVSFSQR